MQFIKDCFIKSKTKLLRNNRFKINPHKVFLVIIFMIVSLSFFRCSEDKDVNLDKLAKVYVDLLVVEDYYEGTDSLEIKKAEIYEKYDLDTATFNKSFRKINYDQEKWNEFFKITNTYLDSLKAKNKN